MKFKLTLILIFLILVPGTYLTSSNSKAKVYKIVMRDYDVLRNYNGKIIKVSDNQYKKIRTREENILQNLVKNKYQLKRSPRKKNTNPTWNKKVVNPHLIKKKKILFKYKNDIKRLLEDKPQKSNPEKGYQITSSNQNFIVSVSDLNPKAGYSFSVYLYTKLPMKLIKGTFGGKPIRFAEYRKNVYRSLIGVDLYEPTGLKNLRITFYTTNWLPVNFSYKIKVKNSLSLSRKIRKKRKSYKTVKKKKTNYRGVVLKFSKNKRKLLTHPKRLQEKLYFKNKFKSYNKFRYWEGAFHYPINNSNPSKLKYSYGRLRTYLVSRNRVIRTRHRGIDIASPTGTKVKASNHGVVVISGHYRIRGKSVVIDHGQGVYTAYYHLSKITVKNGQYVKKGSKIGEVGSTGLSTGPHVHWEMHVNGVNINPHQWYVQDIDSYSNAIAINHKVQPNYTRQAVKKQEMAYHYDKRKKFQSKKINSKPLDQF